jgi:IS30 family transposase
MPKILTLGEGTS